MGKIILLLLIGVVSGVLLSNYFSVQITPKSVTPPTENKATIPTQTAPSLTAASPTPDTVVQAAKGNIDIELGYPAGGIPPLKVCLFAVPAKVGMYGKPALCETTATNQTEMTLAIEPGNYHIFAWPAAKDSGTLVGSWTPAVACGLSVDCNDHSPLTLTVKSDQITPGIEIKDWYGDGKGYPAKP